MRTSTVPAVPPGDRRTDWLDHAACRDADPDLFFPASDTSAGWILGWPPESAIAGMGSSVTSMGANSGVTLSDFTSGFIKGVTRPVNMEALSDALTSWLTFQLSVTQITVS